FAQDLSAVCTEFRRRSSHRPRGTGQPSRDAYATIAAIRHCHSAMRSVWMGESLRYVTHDTGRYACREKAWLEFLRICHRETVRQKLGQCFSVRDATGIIGIARVGRSISQIQNVAEFSKLAIVAH